MNWRLHIFRSAWLSEVRFHPDHKEVVLPAQLSRSFRCVSFTAIINPLQLSLTDLLFVCFQSMYFLHFIYTFIMFFDNFLDDSSFK